MLVEWTLSIVVAIFKLKGNIKNCSCYGTILGHGMNLVEGVLEKRLCGIVTANEMQDGFCLRGEQLMCVHL